MMMDNLKVFFAATFGFGSPVANLFIDSSIPLLNALVLVGQISVAVATTVYIWRKAQALRRKNKRKTNERLQRP
jgi:hypothetical protein